MNIGSLTVDQDIREQLSIAFNEARIVAASKNQGLGFATWINDCILRPWAEADKLRRAGNRNSADSSL